MLPTGEQEILKRDAADAVNLAVVGEVRDGMTVLLAGLVRAESLRPSGAWSDELVAGYREALARYCAFYGTNGERPETTIGRVTGSWESLAATAN